MKVIRARVMGMCFGVVDALATTNEVEDPSSVTIHGELVHNAEIKRRLGDRGFRQQSESQRELMPETAMVLVTAHGVSDRRLRDLRDAGKKIIDTTCPLVRNVHAAARAFSRDGWFVVVLGRKNHVEVNGIVEDLNAFVIVENESEVTAWPFERIGVICQSTTPEWKAERIVRLIRVANAGRDIRFISTICRPTRERQESLEELARTVTVLVVVGGANSNNTVELVRRATSLGLKAHHVESAHDIRADWFADVSLVGLTAGTSTPDEVINEVEAALLAIEPAGITEQARRFAA